MLSTDPGFVGSRSQIPRLLGEDLDPRTEISVGVEPRRDGSRREVTTSVACEATTVPRDPNGALCISEPKSRSFCNDSLIVPRENSGSKSKRRRSGHRTVQCLGERLEPRRKIGLLFFGTTRLPWQF